MFSEKKNEEVKKKRENVTNEIMLVFDVHDIDSVRLST